MFLIDLTHTSHCRAHTGVQRVSRSLYAELVKIEDILPICYDRFAKCWRPLSKEEMLYLEPPVNNSPDTARGTKWTLGQRSRGYLDSLKGRTPRLPIRQYSGLIVPEIFNTSVGAAYQELRPLLSGPMVAVCHDLLAINYPHLTPMGSVSRFPTYLEHLRQFDGIAANSVSTAHDLGAYWSSRNTDELPVIEPILLGTDDLKVEPFPASQNGKVRILCVGTLEARKNHETLLDAAEMLWKKGRSFELVMVGMVNLETGSKAMRRIISMEKQGLSVKWLGAISESRLHQEYAKAHFTVYPSIAEGFGLPVAESMRFGRACVTANNGAIAEIAQGGGCVMVDTASARAIADGMDQLISNDHLRRRLELEATSRELRSWSEYGTELISWLKVLASPEQKPAFQFEEAVIAKSV
ncbi:glycosyltransferase family 1 protein [Rubellicoccus peritrichatus]|uniref:Glycosyltransferase family 1 protein n=1 Tax=Rubellicoccus peritrichatus TaxID=3080537 RepID=A0AAQ3QW05_9BACT|nr:glycosyltransferase family 1 protein [Puniceicoccus sp. CR14]WOO42153.1 glycosyltransferase family 1 protein [Puniceicoccus sp. CR14]